MFLKFLDSQSSATNKEKKSLYKSGRSVYDFLPWVDYDPKNKIWMLEDGQSVATLINIQPKSCEARPESYLEEINDSINNIINSVPQLDPPFVLQFFVYNEESLRDLKERLSNHIPDHLKETKLTKDFLKRMTEHFSLISNPDGLFYDKDITDSAWFAKTYNVKLCMYRKLSSVNDLETGITAVNELLEVSTTLINGLNGNGIKAERNGQKELYEWMLPFFNDTSDYNDSIDELIKSVPYPGDENLPWGTDLVKLLFLNEPSSNLKDGTWEFGKKLFKAFTVNAYRKVPKVGHLSAERNHSDKFFAVFDKFPTGTMTNITVTIAPSSFIKSKIDKIKNSSKGGSSESKQSKDQAEAALDAIETGDHLYPVTTTFYIKGSDKKDLNTNIRTVKSLLMNNDIHLIESRDDEIPLNQFCTNLPFCYDFKNDEYDMRSRLLFSSQISRLLPLYGRSRGTGNPGLIFFNRGAEDFSFDILKDRSSNAFGAILGPPGSGKSALLVYMIWMWAAIARPKFFILEKGDSFKLLGQYLSKMDMSVNRVSLKPNGKISLPPFANATTMIYEKENPKPFIDDEEDDNEARDYLGEMELLARVMITGGDKIEEDELRAEHKVSIREAITNAAKKRYFDNKKSTETPNSDQIVRPSHVIEELNILSKNAPQGSAEKDKLRSMAKSMSRYSEGLEGDIFNSPGKALPEVDVTIMDFGLFAQEGYEGQLALSFMTQMQQIISIAERDQYSGQPIIIIGDESHLFLKNELLAPYVVKIGKMMRKLDTWPWFATQNLEDWANESKKMLSMFEWFIAMACPKEEIEQISKFRDIDENQKSLLLSCHKMRGLYTEGVVLSKTMPPSLFRSIPPSFALALAMTDPNEKAARKKLMDLHGISELEAVEMISEQIKEKRTAI